MSCGVTLCPDINLLQNVIYLGTIRTIPLELASAALNVSLITARSTSNLALKVTKEQHLRPREADAFMDCLENIGSSVDELEQSLVAMKDLEGGDFELEKANIQTWISADLQKKIRAWMELKKTL